MFTFQKINLSSTPLVANDEEKAEAGSISTFDSIKRDSYNGHRYIAVSPDGTQVVTLNTETYQLTLYM